MQHVKKTADYTIYQKKSGRYAVKDKGRQLVHGEEKARILLAESLIKRSEARPATAAETPAETEAAEGQAAS